MVSTGLVVGQRRGFTLTELAIVLGVIGLILGAIWVAAGQAYQSQKVAQATREFLAITSSYKSLWGIKGIDVPGCFTTAQDVTCMGVNAGYFPSDMLPGVSCETGNYSTYPQTPWGGGSYAMVLTCQSYNTVALTFYGLSQAACIGLASNISTTSSNLVYQAIYGGGGGSCDYGYWCQWLPPYGVGPAWTSSQINTYCGAGNSNDVQIGVAAR